MIKTMAGALTIALLWPATAMAHRLDEYLQAARVSLERTGVLVELDLTPGANVASTIVPLIDRDGDGAISPGEIEAYGRAVLAELSVSLDGNAVSLTLMSIDAPTIGEMTEGMGTIRLRATGVADTWSGTRNLLVENRHLPAASVYMINALLPDDPGIAVVSQNRNGSQSSARIEYRVEERGTQLTSLAIGGLSLAALFIFRQRAQSQAVTRVTA
jgi:hypothetical protein